MNFVYFVKWGSQLTSEYAGLCFPSSFIRANSDQLRQTSADHAIKQGKEKLMFRFCYTNLYADLGRYDSFFNICQSLQMRLRLKFNGFFLQQSTVTLAYIATVLMTIYAVHIMVTKAKCEKLKKFNFGLIPRSQQILRNEYIQIQHKKWNNQSKSSLWSILLIKNLPFLNSVFKLRRSFPICLRSLFHIQKFSM